MERLLCIWTTFIFYLLLVGACSPSSKEGGPDWVPEMPGSAPNYWCTWYAQNYWQQRGGEITDFDKINNPNAREELTYKHIFDPEEGWAVTYLPRGRSDYYFLIDHGWQTKKQDERLFEAEPFFSLQIDVRDFPEYGYTRPEEALRLFNEEIRSYGWKGLGIWVRGELTPALAEQFVKWSKYAGIGYWKIDGGDIANFNAFKAKEQFFPELVLEYVTPAGNLNPGWEQPGQQSYPSIYKTDIRHKEQTLRVLQNSDVFRTYDASPILMSTTTLRRVHDILQETHSQPQYRSILNVQDDCNVAAALGCLVASKRHPNYGERLYKGRDLHHQLSGKRHMQKRMNEPERLGRWQRIAPPFPSGEGTYLASDYDWIDCYPYDEYATWNKATYGKVVYQSAPAIMARNMPLPEVELIDETGPYVVATAYPNGPVCVATEGRVSPENEWFYPRAKVTIQVSDAYQPIGIFGYYEQLTLVFNQSVEGCVHIWAQDLLADVSHDIKDKIQINENQLIIPGKLIETVGLSAADEGDISAPGLVLKIEK
ncbi:MAG: hypothetical protein LBT50_03325 [Prevotellaceae bacterium]|jgi:hypothetical protein|nr:hypothetical protein [Prevotellaceae bacterium]